MPEAALHLLLWCLATWLAGVSVLLHMTFGILTLAVRQLTAFLGLRIKVRCELRARHPCCEAFGCLP